MLKHSPTKAQPCSEQSWTALWEPWKPHSCCSSRLLSMRVVHPQHSAARESSSVLPVEYSSLSRELRAAGPGSQLHTRWRRRDGPPARPARRCRAVSVRFKRSGPPAGTNDTSDGRRPARAREGEVVDQMGAAGEAHAGFGGRAGRGTQGTEEGLL